MRGSSLLLLSLIALGCLITTAQGISPSDPLIYRTEWNWFNYSNGFIQSTNPGAYIKFKVRNSQKVHIRLDLPKDLSENFCTVSWSIDFGAMQSALLPSSGPLLRLADNLDGSSDHSVYFFIRNLKQSLDRWGPKQYVRITDIDLDNGGIIVKEELQPKRALIYWDSIGEGVRVLGIKNNSFEDNDSHETWAFATADAIDAELSLVAWGGQGYTVGGGGNIPHLYDPSGNNSSGFQWLNSQVRRDFSICPDYILNGHGTNDGLRKSPPIQVLSAALGWMKAMRNLCKRSKIFVIIPFGGFEESSIEAAYYAYAKSSPKDNLIHLIKLGRNAARGLSRWGNPTFVAPDGVHPYAWRSAALSAHIVKGIAPFL